MLASGLRRRAESCPKSCHEPKRSQRVASGAQAGDKAALVAQAAWQLTCGQGSAFPTQYLQQWELLECNHAPRQPGANLPLPLMWLGWHVPQRCQAVSPRLSGTGEYLQAGLAGPCAGVREAPVLGVSCRVGGSGKWDGLLSSCPQQGCSLVIRTVPQLSSAAGSLFPSPHFPPPCPLSAG